MEKIIILAILMLATTLSSAKEKLIEFDRVGQTRSVHLHYIDKESAKKTATTPRRYTAEEIYSKLLPIHTEGMRPGVVHSREVNLPSVLRPVFIIGADEKSISWLTVHKEELLAAQAIGLLVEVQTLDQLKRIGLLASGLQLAPSSGQYIADTLGVDTYPVLITNIGIEQ